MPKGKKYVEWQKPPFDGQGWCGCYFPGCRILTDDPEKGFRAVHCFNCGEYTVPLTGPVVACREARVPTKEQHAVELQMLARAQHVPLPLIRAL